MRRGNCSLPQRVSSKAGARASPREALTREYVSVGDVFIFPLPTGDFEFRDQGFHWSPRGSSVAKSSYWDASVSKNVLKGRGMNPGLWTLRAVGPTAFSLRAPRQVRVQVST